MGRWWYTGPSWDRLPQPETNGRRCHPQNKPRRGGVKGRRVAVIGLFHRYKYTVYSTGILVAPQYKPVRPVLQLYYK